MGARGKKRVRANGQVASGKQTLSRPGAVPKVEAAQVLDGLETLRSALARHGDPKSGPEWNAAYVEAQEDLRDRHTMMLGDRILWRATFLNSLLSWDEFQDLHADDGQLPTPAMLHVAATIPTYGDDTAFDSSLFERRLTNAPQNNGVEVRRHHHSNRRMCH